MPAGETLYPHLAAKADAVRSIAPLQREELETTGMNRLYYELEQPLSSVLADMEKQGISVDALAISELGKELQTGIAADMAEIYRLRGFGVQHQFAQAARGDFVRPPRPAGHEEDEDRVFYGRRCAGEAGAVS